MTASIRRRTLLLGGALVGVGGIVLPGPAGIVCQALLALTAAAATLVASRMAVITSTAGLGLLRASMVLAAVERLLQLAPHSAAAGLSPLLSLTGFLCILGALTRISAARAPKDDMAGRLDTALVMVATAVVLYDVVSLPVIARSEDASVIAVYTLLPLLQAPVVAACFRILLTGGHRITAAWLMCASASTALGAMVAHATTGIDQAPPTAVEVVLAISMWLIVAAMTHPTYPKVTGKVAGATQSLAWGRLAVVGLALVAVPATMFRAADGVQSNVPAAGALLCALLLFARLVHILRALERQREFDHALSRIGQAAIAKSDVADFIGEVEATVSTAARCTVTLLAQQLVTHGPDQLGGETQTFVETAQAVVSSALIRFEAESTLRFRALHDGLTGLPNRVLFIDRLEHALAAAERHRLGVAVLFIDLDGFKIVNDTWGHHAGDELLTEVGSRLKAAVRNGDTVARLAGDEFGVVVAAADAADAATLAGRIEAALATPFALAASTVTLGGSVGVAVSRARTMSAEQLVQEADRDMYRAKLLRKAVAIEN